MSEIRETKLERELVAILSRHCGERGDNEGAVETLNRIIRERDTLDFCLVRTLGCLIERASA